MSDVIYRAATPTDYAQWRPLWDGYCAFYSATVPEENTQQTWSRVTSTTATDMRCIVAEVGGRVVGFVTYVLHASTFERKPICYLEDLFVAPDSRGTGLGKGLIEQVVATAKQAGWPRVYWHTHRDNATARKSYDRFVPADDVVRYTVRL